MNFFKGKFASSDSSNLVQVFKEELGLVCPELSHDENLDFKCSLGFGLVRKATSLSIKACSLFS